jgi:hypothetical protein
MKLRKLFPCCLPRPDEDAYLQPLTLFQPRSNGSIEEVLEASSRAREETWQQIGTLEPLVLSHLVNPALMGGPRWPAMRQARPWLCITYGPSNTLQSR